MGNDFYCDGCSENCDEIYQVKNDNDNFYCYECWDKKEEPDV